MDREWFHTFFEQDYFRKTAEQVDIRVERSIPQVEFIIDALKLSRDDRILDLCCGYGAHAITFVKRGYDVIGLDLCKRALRLAAQKAQRDNVRIRLVRSDMRALPFGNEFDAIYNFFSSFGYFENDSEDLMVLKEVSRILRPGGRFLVDIVNGSRLLNRFEKRSESDCQERTYDKKTKRLRTKWTFADDDTGECREHLTAQRLYSVSELASMLDSVGLRALSIYGDAEKSEYNEDSQRIIIVAQKT